MSFYFIQNPKTNLDSVYKNTDLLVTKEHVHQNINELISNATRHICVAYSIILKRQKRFFHQYHVYNRGRLIVEAENDF